MAFFGITALGSPNTFQSNLVSALGINVFSDEEFEKAFQKVDRDGSGAITPDEVEDLLYQTYGFPPLENEVTMFMEKFDLNQDGKVTLEEFKKALVTIREEMKQKSGGAVEYTSHNKMKEERFKHKRMNNEVTDKYKLPMTSAQTSGFFVKDKQQQEIAK